MHILLSNDDGIYSSGLRALYTALREAGHSVDVYAPAAEQSAASSKITIDAPLRILPISDGNFSGNAVTGTPADCVQMALSQGVTPDMVVSGINAGPNLGIDVFYSGTVAAALEGTLAGIPSLALSRNMRKDDDPLDVARHAVSLLTTLPWAEIPADRLINVNYPDCSVAEAKGVRACPLSPSQWKAAHEKRLDMRGRPYFWFNLGTQDRFHLPADEAETDVALLRDGYITVTPLRYEINDAELVARLALTLTK